MLTISFLKSTSAQNTKGCAEYGMQVGFFTTFHLSSSRFN